MPHAEYHMQVTSSRNTKSAYNHFLSGIAPRTNCRFCHRMDTQFLLKYRNSMHHHLAFKVELNGHPNLQHSNTYFSFCKDRLSATNAELILLVPHSKTLNLRKVDSFADRCRWIFVLKWRSRSQYTYSSHLMHWHYVYREFLRHHLYFKHLNGW